MNSGMPQFMLFVETGLNAGGDNRLGDGQTIMASDFAPDRRPPSASSSGSWRFVLRSVDGVKYFEAADAETDVFGERLDLLTLVRAVESLDQSSRVTLIGCSNYIRQGIQFGMPEWRTNDWLWERFGQMVPVKHADLWQRLDRLMEFHQVECRVRRIDTAHPAMRKPNCLEPHEEPAGATAAAAESNSARVWDRVPVGFRERVSACEGKLRRIAAVSRKAMQNLRNSFEQVRNKLHKFSIPGSV
jgi:ribonuclease HI